MISFSNEISFKLLSKKTVMVWKMTNKKPNQLLLLPSPFAGEVKS